MSKGTTTVPLAATERLGRYLRALCEQRGERPLQRAQEIAYQTRHRLRPVDPTAAYRLLTGQAVSDWNTMVELLVLLDGDDVVFGQELWEAAVAEHRAAGLALPPDKDMDPEFSPEEPEGLVATLS